MNFLLDFPLELTYYMYTLLTVLQSGRNDFSGNGNNLSLGIKEALIQGFLWSLLLFGDLTRRWRPWGASSETGLLL